MELWHKVAINSCPWDGKSVSSACRQTALTSGCVCSYSYMKFDAVGLKDTRGLPKTEPSEEFCLWKAGSKNALGSILQIWSSAPGATVCPCTPRCLWQSWVTNVNLPKCAARMAHAWLRACRLHSSLNIYLGLASRKRCSFPIPFSI